MPTVPYTAVPGISPQDIPTPEVSVRAGPDTFGGNIAGAISHLGTTFGQVGDEMYSRAVAMQNLRNESEAVEADAKYELQVNQAYVDFESKKGKNAVDAYGGYSKGLNDLRTSMRGDLSNDLVRKQFDARSLSTMNRGLFSAGRHMASENASYAVNAARAGTDAAIDSSRYSANDKEFEDNLAKIEEHANFVADAGGMSPEARSQLIFKDKSGAYAARIISTARRDPLAAQALFDQAVKDGRLHSSDFDRVDRAVRTEMTGAGARNISNQVWRDQLDPEGFLQKRAPGARIEGLNPEFSKRLQAAVDAAERATGEKANIESLARTTTEQARIRAEHEAMPGGVAAHPAAMPGTSRHEFGEAADISDGKVLDWLHKNAGAYGLEFLAGRTGVNDPGHIQLARGASPTRTMPTYEVSETALADRARSMAAAQRPGDVDFAESAVRHTIGTYRQNRQLEQQSRYTDFNTLLGEMEKAPVHTVDELRTRSQEANLAWESLNARDQLNIEQKIRKGVLGQSDVTEYRRLLGMSKDPNQFGDFLNEDIANNPKLSVKDANGFIKSQLAVQKNAEADPRVGYAMGVNGIGPLIPEDLRKDKEQMNVLRGFMYEEIKQWRDVNPGKAMPSSEELKEIGRRALTEVKPEGGVTEQLARRDREGQWFPATRTLWHYLWSSPRERLIDLEVPSEDKEAIRSDPAWAERNRPPPNDDEIKTIYMMKQYDKLYGKSK